jgi:hypothetical protein
LLADTGLTRLAGQALALNEEGGLLAALGGKASLGRHLVELALGGTHFSLESDEAALGLLVEDAQALVLLGDDRVGGL